MVMSYLTWCLFNLLQSLTLQEKVDDEIIFRDLPGINGKVGSWDDKTQATTLDQVGMFQMRDMRHGSDGITLAFLVTDYSCW